ncbi:MAG: thermonuclease family protein [Planctomycetota bacterium]|nr:thermonuclease family protein [Planctomycetota bacterium]
MANEPIEELRAIRQQLQGRFQPRHRWRRWFILALVLLVAIRLLQSSLSRDSTSLDAGEHKVSRVVDGDTIVLENKAKIRFIGVDTPEMDEAPTGPVNWAKEAKEFTRRAVDQRNVRLEFDRERVDKYHRFLAYVWYIDSNSNEELLLNEQLIRAGLGKPMLQYPYSQKMKQRFKAAEKEAQGANLGFWSEVQ